MHFNWELVSNEGVDEPAALLGALLGWQRHHSLAGEEDVDDNTVILMEILRRYCKSCFHISGIVLKGVSSIVVLKI